MMVYSLLETARANGLNPQKYLEYLLEARSNKNMSDEELENPGNSRIFLGRYPNIQRLPLIGKKRQKIRKNRQNELVKIC